MRNWLPIKQFLTFGCNHWYAHCTHCCNPETTIHILRVGNYWNVYFPFTSWKLQLAQNERIFKNESRSQHSLIYATVQAATKFYFLPGIVIRLELDFNVVLTWLTNTIVSYPTNMMSLICDCRSLMDRDRVVQVHHIYREANACVQTLQQSGELTNRTFCLCIMAVLVLFICTM